MSKKFIFCILILQIFLLFNICYAGSITKLEYDGATHDYNVRDITLMLNNRKFEAKEGQMPPIILNNRTLVPVREVFETLGGKVDWINAERRVDVTFDNKVISLWIDKTTAKVDDKEITLDVPAKIVNNKTMVPVRFVSEQGNLLVNWDQPTYTVDVKFQKTKITGISFVNVEGTNCMLAKADGKITGYKYFSLPKDEQNDYRLVLDIENCEFDFDTTNTKFPEGMLAAIRFGKQENDVNRIVLDLREETDYVVTLSKDRTKLYFAMAEKFVIPGEEETVTKPGENEVKEPIKEETAEQSSGSESKENTETKAPEEKSGEKESENIIIRQTLSFVDEELEALNNHNYETTPEEEEINYDVIIESIKYSTTTERVKIKYSGNIKYDDSVLTNPNRVVIDIPDAKLDVLGPTEIAIMDNVITSIRFSQYTKSSVRIVLDLASKCEYNIYKRTSELQISVKESTYKNIKYKKNISNSQITLQNVQISDLSFDQNSSKFKYTINYNSNKYDFGAGQLNLDDEFVSSVTINDNDIVILDTGKCVYSVRQSIKNVVITVRKEDDKVVQEALNRKLEEERELESGEERQLGKRVIVIDVGHGGSDPGACNGDEQEKKYNLKIALNLYDMLKERDDVQVFIDREDNDTYLNREDRVAFANNISPDFIVSVHNNSLDNKSYSGTMVLYYNNETESNFGDITSKECAEIVLNELIKQLGTINRGVVNRSDLHILSKTPCPSILCEVCFISNDEELERLKTKAFQEKAAKAIYDGIDQILKIM